MGGSEKRGMGLGGIFDAIIEFLEQLFDLIVAFVRDLREIEPAE